MKKILIWYGPLLKAVISPLFAFGLVLFYHLHHHSSLDIISWLAISGWFSLGVFYTHIFEYLHHRFALHYGLPGLKWMKNSHREHHRVFHHFNYKTRNPQDLHEITSRWYIFPVLLFIHYLAFLALLPNKYIVLAPVFFLGVLLRFLAYETTHYLSHLADNIFDLWIEKIPLVRELRTNQDRHHFRHHVREEINFGFVGRLLDLIFQTLFPPFKFRHRP
ncbi:MAG: hypothetical protein G01um101444_224 [Parcubacteria group bacterium Gr01-1014_44]|nr:MAG: hypothetical protein G01um101444_224 [Parcubacteria group bacterium Gr01-1014_44]